MVLLYIIHYKYTFFYAEYLTSYIIRPLRGFIKVRQQNGILIFHNNYCYIFIISILYMYAGRSQNILSR